MKIGAFVYDFEHKKTQEGLLYLYLNNINIECILAAPPVKLEFYQSKIRVGPKDLVYVHPKLIAEKISTLYYVVPHNSRECENIVRNHNLDLGIILGARILKENIINTFKVGILNFHPGLLPENRGLDNIKWAILKGYKQGVTSHLITKEIDRGPVLLRREIKVYPDDTFVDIFLRIQNLEQKMMVESIHLLERDLLNGKLNYAVSEKGNYFKAVPPDLETVLDRRFEEYKKDYDNL